MNMVDIRNKRVLNILEKLYQRAVTSGDEIDEAAYKNSLDKLFSTSAWGFREILLVVLVGMLLDQAFKPSCGLYDCNPRALYEGPIKEFLIEKKIPHRKSGPLNVAKATVGLNSTWAAQRRPSEVAAEIVFLVNYLETGGTEKDRRIDNLGVSLFRRLIACSESIEALKVNVDPVSDPEFLYRLCRELIERVTDAGNTPQIIAGYLLKNYYKRLNADVTVYGEDDRASVTSTTSKKPGDIVEETAEGVVRKVYEITVKRFDLPRIRDSYDAVSVYNYAKDTNVHEIIVICRAIDCPPEMKSSGLHGCLGSYIYQGLVYYYWDIYEWIAVTLQQMSDEGRLGFYRNLKSYIDDINTSEKVKKEWKFLHEK